MMQLTFILLGITAMTLKMDATWAGEIKTNISSSLPTLSKRSVETDNSEEEEWRGFNRGNNNLNAVDGHAPLYQGSYQGSYQPDFQSGSYQPSSFQLDNYQSQYQLAGLFNQGIGHSNPWQNAAASYQHSSNFMDNIRSRTHIPVPYQVPVSYPVALKIRQPLPIHIPVPLPLEKTVVIPVEKRVPFPVEKPVPFPLVRSLPDPIPQPYPVPVPVYRTKIIVHGKSYD